MTTSISPSAALAVIEPAFSEPEKLALAGFLAGYSGQTREAYALDLRQFTCPEVFCRHHHLPRHGSPASLSTRRRATLAALTTV